MLLSVQEYDKLIQLISQMQDYENDVRLTILNTLQQLFQNCSMAFFLTDENEQFINPVSRNISPEMMNIYKKYYYKTDIFHTFNINRSLLNKNIIHITDIMPMSTFESTEFYNDLLKKMDVYDEIALPLIYHNKLIGVIGIMKPKSLGCFCDKEIEYASIIKRNIIPCLKSYLDKNRAYHNSCLFQNCTKEAPIGIIVLDNSFKAIHYNYLALEYCREITGQQMEKCSIDSLVNILKTRLVFKTFTSNTYLYASIQNYSFKIVPFAVPNFNGGFNTCYTAYLTNNQYANTIDYIKLEELFKLTKREYEIILLISQGYSNKRIAEDLYLSKHTVKTHIQNIFKKMKVNSRTEILHKVKEIQQISS